MAPMIKKSIKNNKCKAYAYELALCQQKFQKTTWKATDMSQAILMLQMQ